MQDGTILELIKATGVDPTTLVIGVPVDVSDKRIEIESYDESGLGEVVWRLVTKVVRKEDTTAYQVFWPGARPFKCSGDHLIAEVVRVRADDVIIYSRVDSITKEATLGVTLNGFEPVYVHKLDEITEIYDIEVEGTHCYFSNGVLSHNTMYGSPDRFPGGKSFEHGLQVSAKVRRSGWLPDDKAETKEGIQIAVTIDKHKTFGLHKTDDDTHLNLYFKDGFEKAVAYSVYDEAVNADLIVARGAWVYLYDANGEEYQKWNGKEKAKNTILESPELRELINHDLARKRNSGLSGATPSVGQVLGVSEEAED